MQYKWIKVVNNRGGCVVDNSCIVIGGGDGSEGVGDNNGDGDDGAS